RQALPVRVMPHRMALKNRLKLQILHRSKTLKFRRNYRCARWLMTLRAENPVRMAMLKRMKNQCLAPR
ncbi:MAG: hypothetical protein RR729_14795, partial [Comamonas sp.]